MAILQFLWFQPAFGSVAAVDMAEFSFAMQIAMILGFCTAHPVNRLLIRMGLKERM